MSKLICTPVGDKIEKPVPIEDDFNKLLLHIAENIKNDNTIYFVVVTKT